MTSTASRVALVLALVLTMMAPMASHAAARGTELYLASVARSPGASGSFWYTTAWIHNPSNEVAHLAISLLHRGRANPTPDEQYMSVEPGRTVTVGDVLWDLFGLEQGAGAVRFESDVQVVVSARVYNLPGTQIAESQGQFFAGLPVEHAMAVGASTDIPGVTQPSDGSFRCNFGLVETRGETADVRVVLLDGQGLELASATYALGPFEALQKGLSDLGNNVAVDGGRLNVTVTSGRGAVLAFASIIGNGAVSQDPSTLEMEYDIEVAGENGGITAVTAGPGLLGGGSEGAVSLAVGAGSGVEVLEDGVGIAASGVTGSMIADGEVVKGLTVSGQVLKDEVALVAGENVSVSATGQTVEISASSTPASAETQYELEITTSTGAWTTERAVGVPYQTSDGAWRFRFNVFGRAWSSERTVTLVFDGIIFKHYEGFEQAVTVHVSGVPGLGHTVPGTGDVELETSTGSERTRFSVSGDVELESKPSFVD